MNKKEIPAMLNKKTAVIGAGYWGKNLIRNFQEIGALSAVCDLDTERLNFIKTKYPHIKTTTEYKELFDNADIDSVVIATPAATHYKLVKEFLLAGKDVLVEKPFTTSYEEAEELVEIAEKKNLILMVGMVFLYNAAVRKVKEIISSGEIGDIYYIFFQRRNLGKVRNDVNAWWNFAPHDISILLYWLNKELEDISVRGFSFIQPDIEDVIMASLKFKNSTAAFIHTSWLDPSKVRRAIIVGSKKMIIYDDMSSDMKVQLYDKGIDKSNVKNRLEEFETFGEFQLRHRAGDIHIPKIDFTEPLITQCSHFISCCNSRKEPLSSGRRNLEMVKILEAGQKSLKDNGSIVAL